MSHPSTIPARVGIRVEVGEVEEGGGGGGVSRPRTAGGGRRSLLDTTRAPVARVATTALPTITITVTATTKGYYAPGMGPPSHLPVAITAQPLRFGVMPADSGPVLAAVAALAVGIAWVVPWWAEEGVRAVGGWVDGGGGEEEEGGGGEGRGRKAR